MSGGGGGGGYYSNLDKLYGMQADQSQQLMGLASGTVFPAYQKLLNTANNADSLSNQNMYAGQAGADARAAGTASIAGAQKQLASEGVNAADMSRGMRGITQANTATEAAATNAARTGAQQRGFSMLQDATALGMGTPTQATAAASAAGNAATSAGALYNQQNAIQSNNIANAVAGGMNLWKGFKAGGYVNKYAVGGPILNAGIAPPPPPSGMPRQSGAAGILPIALPLMSKTGANAIGSGISSLGSAAGSNGLQAFGAGMANPAGVKDAIGLYQSAAKSAVDQALPSVGLDAGAVGADAASGVAAGTAAETAGAMGTAAEGLGAGAALGAAMPWVGAAMLAGYALNLFADGGHVSDTERMVVDQSGVPRDNMLSGGNVNGPGGPKDDQIPAWLSHGEYVLPVGTVKKYGLAKLDKMRQEGLEFEKQLGIRSHA